MRSLPIILLSLSALLSTFDHSLGQQEVDAKSDDGSLSGQTTESKADGKTTQISEVIRELLPAIVLVEESPTSHGTGFFFSSDGWILTNHHVIANCPVDLQTGRQLARVTVGRLGKHGEFETVGRPVWAAVFKTDRRSDLAILRLLEMPADDSAPPITRVDYLQLAQSSPKSPDQCIAIGMPRDGVRWTVRLGNVAGSGLFPENIDSQIQSQSAEDRFRLLALVAPEGSHRVLLSTCPIHPGDSGGPLLDREGRLVGITSAIPADDRFDKFTYHVHLDEIAAFIADIPNKPKIIPPYFKPSFTRWQVEGANLVKGEPLGRISLTKGEELVGVFFDLDGDHAVVAQNQLLSILAKEERALWVALGLEWAIRCDQRITYYFDLDGDGAFDRVIQTPSDEGDFAVEYRVEDGQWILGRASYEFLDEIRFVSTSVQAAFKIQREGLPAELRR